MIRPRVRRLRLTGLRLLAREPVAAEAARRRDPRPARASCIAADDTVEKLAGLAEMGEAGILTEAEFELAKSRLLARPW